MNLPNLITLFRILITPLFFTALLSYKDGQEYYRSVALCLFLIASITDAIDGFLARALHIRSDLGRFLDPLADKLLLLSGFLGILVVTALPYRPPLWITVTIVFRDIVIIVGLIMIYLLTGTIRVEPNLLGKFTTAFQMATLVAILAAWKISIVLWNITAALTIVSCLVYIFREFKNMTETS